MTGFQESEEIEVTVWHDLDGNMVAVGYQRAGSELTVEPIAASNQRVLTATVREDDIDRLVELYRVDVDKACLVRLDGGPY